MHTPASRQPGANFPRGPLDILKKVLGMDAHAVTKPSSATSGQLTSMPVTIFAKTNLPDAEHVSSVYYPSQIFQVPVMILPLI